MYREEVILDCLRILHLRARQHQGLDYLQVFESNEHCENLWFIEDGPGGAITALLPSDYWYASAYLSARRMFYKFL